MSQRDRGTLNVSSKFVYCSTNVKESAFEKLKKYVNALDGHSKSSEMTLFYRPSIISFHWFLQ